MTFRTKLSAVPCWIALAATALLAAGCAGDDLDKTANWSPNKIYAEAKDEMFAHTDIREAPWYVVDADDKKAARLNLISHLLQTVPHQDAPHEKVKLPPRQARAYTRPPIDSQIWVPQRYVVR